MDSTMSRTVTASIRTSKFRPRLFAAGRKKDIWQSGKDIIRREVTRRERNPAHWYISVQIIRLFGIDSAAVFAGFLGLIKQGIGAGDDFFRIIQSLSYRHA